MFKVLALEELDVLVLLQLLEVSVGSVSVRGVRIIEL